MGLRRAHWENQGGFTLIEVMITIIIMGIVFAIASSTWFGAVESRRVDSATNQLAADLRQAHSKAINRLEVWEVDLGADSSTYAIGPAGGTPDSLDLDDVLASDIVTVDTPATIAFCPNGSAEIPSTPPGCSDVPGDPPPMITIRAANNPANNHSIQINPATSEIKVVP
jgi:prepilin-type N-terminal cleavage/methylation domain-containing protein